MTLADFIAENDGKYVEWVDPSNPNQCFDLVAKWIEHGLGYPRLTNGLTYAYQIFTAPTEGLKQNFDIIVNTPEAIPQAGDIMVWDRRFNGTAGHTGIVVSGTLAAFDCFEQNDPTGSPAHIKHYGYLDVLGWLRSKKTMGDNIVRKSYFFDIIWQAFKGSVNTDLVNETQVLEFISWVKSNVGRAGKWDQVCAKAGITGDTNKVTPEQVVTALQPEKYQELADNLTACNLKVGVILAKLDNCVAQIKAL